MELEHPDSLVKGCGILFKSRGLPEPVFLQSFRDNKHVFCLPQQAVVKLKVAQYIQTCFVVAKALRKVKSILNNNPVPSEVAS